MCSWHRWSQQLNQSRLYRRESRWSTCVLRVMTCITQAKLASLSSKCSNNRHQRTGRTVQTCRIPVAAPLAMITTVQSSSQPGGCSQWKAKVVRKIATIRTSQHLRFNNKTRSSLQGSRLWALAVTLSTIPLAKRIMIRLLRHSWGWAPLAALRMQTVTSIIAIVSRWKERQSTTLRIKLCKCRLGQIILETISLLLRSLTWLCPDNLLKGNNSSHNNPCSRESTARHPIRTACHVLTVHIDGLNSITTFN